MRFARYILEKLQSRRSSKIPASDEDADDDDDDDDDGDDADDDDDDVDDDDDDDNDDDDNYDDPIDDGDKYDDEREGETEATGGVQKSEEDNQEQACKRSGSARP